MSAQSQYSDAVIAGMQMLYGEGFLSPGGAEEVGQVLKGRDLSGQRILDLGCGIGGAAVMLVRDFGAARVTGVDVEADSLRRAKEAERAAGLEDRLSFEHVAPGPLPFDAGAFDAVFSKDVICHIPDKSAVFGEVHRVLRPGGRFFCADFVAGARLPGSRARKIFDDWVETMRDYGLSFNFADLAAYREDLHVAGFVALEERDHTAASTEVASREIAFVESPAADPVREVLGADFFAVRQRLTRLRHAALACSGLCHYHFLAQRT